MPSKNKRTSIPKASRTQSSASLDMQLLPVVNHSDAASPTLLSPPAVYMQAGKANDSFVTAPLSHAHGHAAGCNAGSTIALEDDFKSIVGDLESPKEQDDTMDTIKLHDPFLVTFDGESDPLDPRNWNSWKKRGTLFLVMLNTLAVTLMSSSVVYLAPELEVLFRASQTHVIWLFTAYVVGWGPGPLLWAPLSDLLGRKPVYMISLACWMALQVGCARAMTMPVLLVCRFFMGFLGSAAMTNGSGTTQDLYHPGAGLIRAGSCYSGMVFIGPVIGPIIGGAIETYVQSKSLSDAGGFRWLMYFGIMLGAILMVGYAFSDETHHNILLRRRANKLAKQQPGKPWSTLLDREELSGSFGRRLVATTKATTMMIVSEPIVLFCSVWQTTILSIIYLQLESYSVVFARGHGFNDFQTGCAFIGMGAGIVLGCGWSMTGELLMWFKKFNSNGMDRVPELRCWQGLRGAILVVVGLFWFGFTSQPSMHWIVPIVGSGVFGFGAINVLLSTFAYLVDTYLHRSPPAYAAVGLIRSTITAILPVAGVPLYRRLSPQNATLILAVVGVLELLIPVAAMRYGLALRQRSRLAVKK